MIRAGSIIDYRNDPNPTSGDHLDIKILRKYGDGGHVDPSTKQGLLDRFRFGSADNGFKTLADYSMTSGYGPRDTGIPGASKFHKGLDYGIGAGTQINYEGEGKYWSENGIGILSVKDANGNPYEIELTHTAVGDPFDAAGVQSPPTTTTTDNKSQAKEKAQAWKTREMTASEAVDALGNDFGSMKSSRLGAALSGAQENIYQKRADRGMSLGTLREQVKEEPDPA